MIRLDIRQIDSAGDTFFSATDAGYLIFLLIGIVGYFTVPTVANYIVHAAGGGALQQKITSAFGGTTSGMVGMAGGATGSIVSGAGNMAGDFAKMGSMNPSGDMANDGNSDPYFKDKLKGNQ